MNSVEVQLQRLPGGWVCEVDVEEDGLRTRHTVRVSAADVERWGRKGAGKGADQVVQDLVRRSFGFLLAREPATSILRSFDLSVIERYFPEYDRQFKRR